VNHKVPWCLGRSRELLVYSWYFDRLFLFSLLAFLRRNMYQKA
jgi:hypothetical protein